MSVVLGLVWGLAVLLTAVFLMVVQSFWCGATLATVWLVTTVLCSKNGYQWGSMIKEHHEREAGRR